MAPSKPRNQTFNYLYAMAILMVIDDHCSTRIGLLSSIFPYNSFYMPLFVFASGYFFNMRGGILSFLGHKIRKLLVPYLLWNVAAMAVAFLLDRWTGVDWVQRPSLYTVAYMLGNQSPTSLNGAAWFVNMLFWVSVGYGLLRWIVKPGRRNDALLTALLTAAGFAAVQLCIMGYPAQNGAWLFLLRNLFYAQFYHDGYMFRRYGERLLRRCSRTVVCSLCMLVNAALLLAFGSKINFYSTAGMRSFSVWYLPLLTSATGILFYYEIMSYLPSGSGRIESRISFRGTRLSSCRCTCSSSISRTSMRMRSSTAETRALRIFPLTGSSPAHGCVTAPIRAWSGSSAAWPAA